MIKPIISAFVDTANDENMLGGVTTDMGTGGTSNEQKSEGSVTTVKLVPRAF